MVRVRDMLENMFARAEDRLARAERQVLWVASVIVVLLILILILLLVLVFREPSTSMEAISLSVRHQVEAVVKERVEPKLDAIPGKLVGALSNIDARLGSMETRLLSLEECACPKKRPKPEVKPPPKPRPKPVARYRAPPKKVPTFRVQPSAPYVPAPAYREPEPMPRGVMPELVCVPDSNPQRGYHRSPPCR